MLLTAGDSTLNNGIEKKILAHTKAVGIHYSTRKHSFTHGRGSTRMLDNRCWMCHSTDDTPVLHAHPRPRARARCYMRLSDTSNVQALDKPRTVRTVTHRALNLSEGELCS